MRWHGNILSNGMHCVLYCVALLCARVDGRSKDTFYHNGIFETKYLIEGQPDTKYLDECTYGHWGPSSQFSGIPEVLTRLNLNESDPNTFYTHNLCNSASTYSSRKEFYAMIVLVVFNVASAGFLWYNVRQWWKRCTLNKSA